MNTTSTDLVRSCLKALRDRRDRMQDLASELERTERWIARLEELLPAEPRNEPGRGGRGDKGEPNRRKKNRSEIEAALLRALHQNREGLSGADAARSAGVGYPAAKRHLDDLAGYTPPLVRREGERKATRWFLASNGTIPEEAEVAS